MNEVSQLVSIHHLKITALTPVHVGGAQENNPAKDIDYFPLNGETVFLDWDRLFDVASPEEAQRLTNYLANRNIESLHKQLAQFIQRDASIIKAKLPSLFYKASAIKAHIRDGIGRAYLPGSSLKGAFSSVLLNYFCNLAYKHENKKHHKFFILKDDGKSEPIHLPDKEALGDFDTGLMRFIRFTDCIIPQIKYYATKIFSLKGKKGAWKHQRIGAEEKFDPASFMTVFECMAPGSSTFTTFALADGLFEFIKSKNGQLHPNASLVKKTVQEIFAILNDYARTFIRKEIDFFKTFSNAETSLIIKAYQKLLSEIPSDNSYAVMRMASGSGFYGITGDWRYANHFYPIDYPDEIKKYNKEKKAWEVARKIQYKTRRLSFTGNKGNWHFMPLGFIKMEQSDEKQYNEFYEKTKSVITTIPLNKEQGEQAAPPSPPPPYSPRYFTGKLKPGAEVDAVYAGQDKNNPTIKYFKLFIEAEGKEQIVPLRYVADIQEGQLFKVTVTAVRDNKVLSIRIKSMVK